MSNLEDEKYKTEWKYVKHTTKGKLIILIGFLAVVFILFYVIDKIFTEEKNLNINLDKNTSVAEQLLDNLFIKQLEDGFLDINSNGDKSLGQNFYIKGEFKDHARLAEIPTYQKCFSSLINKEKKVLDGIVFLPKKVSTSVIKKKCEPAEVTLLKHYTIFPALSDEIKNIFNSGDLSQITEEYLTNFCKEHESLNAGIADLRSMELKLCKIQKHTDGHPMIYSTLANKKEIIYNVIIFDKTTNYDTGVSLMTLNFIDRSGLSNEDLRLFTGSVVFNIYKDKEG